MRINLQLAYLGLLSVTCISSCFLFFVFLTENAKFVAACSDESTTLPTEAGAAVEHKAAAAPPAIVAHAEIIPINEEVEKLTKNEGEHIQAPQTAAPAAANAPNNVVDDSTTEPVTESAEGWLLPSSVMYSASASDNDIIREKSAVIINEAVEPAHQNENEEMIAVAVEAPALLDDDLQNVQVERESVQESLPDITEIPTITVTELPLEILEPTRGNIEALIIDAAKETIAREHENHTMDVLENSSEAIRKDEEIIKFDDSGGGEHSQPTLTDADLTSSEIPSNIPIVNATKAPTRTTQNESDSPATATPAEEDIAAGGNNDGNTVNLTVEEVPIPVFSEWAQKQMEAAEKQQAKEQEVVNTATQKKNHTNGDGKRAAPLKMRNKNYASPDCGAKIIASNADASNTGAVLSSSKDEYMLSPCGNRIWFVVELCEAIQAQKVELANFELFSSSPKNFTVAVSNRFPTRDWSNVGRFIAEDKRNVQSFDLHPHLFGKFVRVDIHSHYSKEHFCPVSLFRVFGTSEFEAFETEDTPHIDLDDFDDEFGQEQVHAKSPDMNLFKSASDAVLSIVKKAAEVLVKPANQQNTTLTITQTHTTQCRTPATGPYNCVDCSQPLVARINNALSCEYQSLQALLRVPWLLKDLLRTRICAKDFGIELKAKSNGELGMRMQMDVKNSYYLNLLPREYVGALCQMLATQAKAKSPTTAAADDTQDENAVTEPPLNLTIDKKLKKDDFRIIDGTQKKLVTSETTNLGDDIATENAEVIFNGEGAPPPTTATSTTESGTAEAEQIARPPQANIDDAATTTQAPHTSGGKEPTPDVNIFNVPAHNEQQELQKPSQPSEPSAGSHTEEQQSSGDSSDDSSAPSSTTTSIPPANGDSLKVLADSTSSDNAPPAVQPTPTTTVTPTLGSRSEEDAASWENIDNLITSTTAAPSGGEASAHGSQPGVNLQQKIPSGPQSESVFIRLSNRIKALERNMSLSGQYLEELSRRYKKQVEELQLTLTQTVQTVRTLEEQNRRQSELQQLLAQRNTQLKEELDDLSLQVHACIVVIIFVGAFVFLVLMVSILFYRSMRRQTKEVLALYTSTNRKKTASAVAAMQKKLNRRKSFEDFSDHQQSGEKMRRPSEEALMILKESSDGKGVEAVGDAAKNATQRERKMSVCYSNNMSGTSLSHDATIVRAEGDPSAQNIRQRRKGEKHSWPNTEHAQQQARRHLAQLNATNVAGAEHMENFDKVSGRPPRAPPLVSGGENHNKSAGNKSRRKTQLPRRQASVSHDFMGGANSNNPASLDIDSAAEYDESLRLEEDDLDNFIPTSDLAYNEFMPEGPSGYQVDDGVETVDGANADSKKSGKKLSRLTAPAFFKSPFGKSRNKLRNSKSTKHPHESTSWEWYRSKNAEPKALSGSVSASGGFMRASPTVSLDSSSLSEILLPNSRTENSFRILEEAILSSGESIAASSVATTGTSATDNGNGNTNTNGSHSNGSSIASNSNRSSTSSTSTKKKNRSFNKIFRKVF
ncbi:SUN domain-containing ossification factor isoform X1 [Bactrocera neohumeralis]|uniref:SUN domain-containing ossification factor isoform X1 n=1 Tax=Bactrocera neohumeralis TaxID=98809 RepID=UPI0021668E56|nr:SUN domain-containing ossification factor isoform X1 [Bactrocera neohumeralis]